MPGECAVITVDEADEKVDVVGSSTRCIVIWNLRGSPSESP